VIISCPTCATHFKYDAESVPGAQRAHCGQCDAVFPLTTSRSRYRLASRPLSALAGMPVDEALVKLAPTGETSEPTTTLEPLVALLFAAVGSSSGYYLSIVQNTDPVNWTAGGCSAGLLLGWIVIRWMSNRT
jgi:predicted Zn finger-like uncharacterized protein